MQNIKIYSTPTCPYCKMVKQYLSSRNINYTDFDVSNNETILDEMVKISGQMGVPVIVIDNEVIVGFDKSRLEAILK